MKLKSTLTTYEIEVERDAFNREVEKQYIRLLKGVRNVKFRYTEGVIEITVDETAVLEDIAACLLID